MKELTQAQMAQVNGAGVSNLLLVVGLGVPLGAYVGLMTAGYTFSAICLMANNTLEYCGTVMNNTFLFTGENATSIGAGAILSWTGLGSLIGVSAVAGVVLAAAS